MLKIEMNVYEDGEKIDCVFVDIDDENEVRKVLIEMFDCDEDIEYEIERRGDEIYIGVSELMYLWNK